jgi:hypothetical protein
MESHFCVLVIIMDKKNIQTRHPVCRGITSITWLTVCWGDRKASRGLQRGEQSGVRNEMGEHRVGLTQSET